MTTNRFAARCATCGEMVASDSGTVHQIAETSIVTHATCAAPAAPDRSFLVRRIDHDLEALRASAVPLERFRWRLPLVLAPMVLAAVAGVAYVLASGDGDALSAPPVSAPGAASGPDTVVLTVPTVAPRPSPVAASAVPFGAETVPAPPQPVVAELAMRVGNELAVVAAEPAPTDLVRVVRAAPAPAAAAPPNAVPAVFATVPPVPSSIRPAPTSAARPTTTARTTTTVRTIVIRATSPTTTRPSTPTRVATTPTTCPPPAAWPIVRKAVPWTTARDRD